MCKNVFSEIIGKYCWNVGYDKFANLYMRFGQPSFKIIREPRPPQNATVEEKLLAGRRIVQIVGQWKFFLNIAYFTILQNDIKLASRSSSLKNISLAVNILDGQKLIDAKINNKTGETKLEFDLGVTLLIRRCSVDTDGELWFLYGPGSVSSVRGNGICECEELKVEQ